MTIDALAKSVGWDDDFGTSRAEADCGGPAEGPGRCQRRTAGRRSRARQAPTLWYSAGRSRAARSSSAFFTRWRVAARRNEVFAEILAGFLMSGADPSIVTPDPHMVGLNLVMPEDWYVPMKDFPLHMQMLGVPARTLSQGPHLAACGRTGAGTGAARRTALSYPRFSRDRACRAHRPRRGRDERDESRSSFCARWPRAT